MPLALPDLLSVLAHELRSPLAVIQGYIRLLQRQRAPADPESAMLSAMLDATARLGEISRQASDLSAFLKSAPQPGPATDVRTLLDLVARQAPGLTVAPLPNEVATREVSTRRPSPVAAAVAALAWLAHRESGRASLVLAAASADSRHVRLSLTPETAPSIPDEGTPVAFDRGGLGLSLAMASYVLEAEGIAAKQHQAGIITLDLPVDGGQP